MGRRLLSLGLLPVLAGCESLTPPIRGDGYDFRHISGIAFHWPADRLPVRYWVSADLADVRGWVTAAIEVWRRQFLYGEFDGTLVADSSDADVVVTVVPGPPPSAPLSDAPPDRGACSGVTTFNVTPDFLRLDGRLVVELRWSVTAAPEDVVNCLYRVTVHEVGHTLGILAHSPHDGDIMTVVPEVRAPSMNDRATVERLYHTPPDVGPPVLEELSP